MIGLRATTQGIRVGAGILVRAAYFFADEVPAAIDDTTCIARNRTPLADRPYALDEVLGVVRREFGTGADAKLEIEFDDNGTKVLLARFVEDVPF